LELKLERVTVDLTSGRGQREDTPFDLTDKERSLLQYLVERPRQLVRRDELLTEVWGYHPESTSRAVDKTLNRLRAKIEPNKDNPTFLRTVYGEGVCFHPPILRASHNISVRVDRFFGREHPLAEMDRWLHSPGRLLTLTGVGGVGKTRLAHEACRHWLDQGARSDIWVCDFSEATSGEDFISTILCSMAMPGGPSTTLGTLVPALKARGAWVLVLDDIDRLLDRAVEALTLWLTEVPSLQVVATSRERLGCRGEMVLELDGLDDDDAEEMLRDRAGWTDVETEVVRTLVERTEGLPLAIELVGANATSLPLSMLVKQTSWAISRPVQRGGRDRHRTMNAAIRWSWEGLDSESRQALAEATVFREFLPSAATAEVLTCRDPFRILASLRARSLLWERDGKLGMYEVVRHIAEPQLRPEDQRQLRHRHASFCAHTLEYIADEHGRLKGHPMLLDEVGEDNVWAAHAYASHNDPNLALRLVYGILHLLSQSTPLKTLIEVSTAALERAPDAPVDLYNEVRYARAVMQLIANVPGALAELESVLSWARERGNARLEGRTLRGLSLYHQQGRDQIADGEEAIALAESVSEVEAAYAWVGLGWVFIQQKRYEEARNAFGEGSDRFLALGQTGALAWSDSSILWMDDNRVDLERRLNRLLASGGVHALPPSTQTGVVTIICQTLLDLGRYEEAITWSKLGLRLDALHGSNVRTLATCTHNLGMAAAALGDLAQAQDDLERTIRAARKEGSRVASFICELATLRAMRGNLLKARALLDENAPKIAAKGAERTMIALWHAAIVSAIDGSDAGRILVPDEQPEVGRGIEGMRVLARVLRGDSDAWKEICDPRPGTPFGNAYDVCLQIRLLSQFLRDHRASPEDRHRDP